MTLIISSKDIGAMIKIINDCQSIYEVIEYCNLFRKYIDEILGFNIMSFGIKEKLKYTANQKINAL